jgi:hypothetical protein
MKAENIKRTLVYGLGVWAALVAVSLVLAPVEMTNSPLFESFKSIALAIIASGFIVLYLKKVKQSTALEGLIIGAIWAIITIALDYVLYAFGLFGGLTFAEYCNDVASSYVMIPALGAIIMGSLKRA